MPEERGQKPDKEIIYVPAQGYMPPQDNDEIDLIELWNILWDRKWFILGFVALCTAVAAIVSLYVLTPTYKAQATLQVNGQSKQTVVNYLGSNKFAKLLIKQYDLLPRLYPEIWDQSAKKWMVDDERIPQVEQAMSSESFPLNESIDGSTLTITWQGNDPQFCASMLNNVIQEIHGYLQNEYNSPAQTRIQVLREEIENLKAIAEGLENPGEEIFLTIANMQNKIAELRGQDLLARKMSVLDEPIPPQNPEKPNPKLITGLSFVLSLFLAVFLVFFLHFVHTARQKQREAGR